MAVDKALAERMRKAIGRREGLSEKVMMGNQAFFLNGNMIGGASRKPSGVGQFLFRLGKDNPQAESLADGTLMVMGERVMSGFYTVDADACDDKRLKAWAKAAVDFAASLPPK